ncbi:MAG: hypothetical protein M3209_00230 [Acidobacteriota bacterium]|nr:hypothetical protein [Acidobacteriota bacterium]
MKELNINGYKVSIFYHRNGTQLFIQNADGFQIYAHKISGNPLERAVEIIEAQ